MECNFENCPNFERLGKKFADRILELERENAELKAYKDVNEDFKTAWEELKAENERLKEENKELCKRMATVTYRATGGRLSYSNYTLDAIEQAFYDQLDILSDQKIEPYKQTLQEIKEIAEDAYENESEYQATGVYNEIIQKITKAESEG